MGFRRSEVRILSARPSVQPKRPSASCAGAFWLVWRHELDVFVLPVPSRFDVARGVPGGRCLAVSTEPFEEVRVAARLGLFGALDWPVVDARARVDAAPA